MQETPVSGHMGVTKTQKAVTQLFGWPTVGQDVKQYVITCHSCQRNRSGLTFLPAPTTALHLGLYQDRLVERSIGTSQQGAPTYSQCHIFSKVSRCSTCSPLQLAGLLQLASEMSVTACKKNVQANICSSCCCLCVGRQSDW